MTALPLPQISAAAAYRLRLKRRTCLWRAFRARRRLRPVADNTARILPADIIVILVLRNEMQRLPFFLDYYRKLGAGHFLIVDNASDDGSSAWLLEKAQRGDLSLWQTSDSYRNSRFGLDWSGWLLMRYGHGHWCLTLDADELLAYPGMGRHDLRDLTDHLDQTGQKGFGAMMLDLFPKGPLALQEYDSRMPPTDLLRWFDAGPYRAVRQSPQGNLWLQGGARDRVFFATTPERAPTLNKIPLIRWHWRYSYTNATHAVLPRDLNALYDGPCGVLPSGVLLHTKFLPETIAQAPRQQQRAEHFHRPDLFDDYYALLGRGPDLWHPAAVRYRGPEQLAELGLCCPVEW
ncbi:glycosyltransferase family 2 protein [Phaeobacter sp. B1627]|uniref:glycosyltransferase family 2 protein n=1 Tax=Phaeobacter sp. B1627 TaxID=2583809 RepID=UPI00111ADBD3|nr:glycosyltransferase family 2 protein [Phaeobacter sp. B1627]TNJ45599.1 glycosyltransferase family 2 protein [Phaeobacter sp. B1627]